MIITQPLEITTPHGRGTGRWRLVEMSDEHDGAEPLCDCGGLASQNPATCGHESPEAARACPVAVAKLAPKLPTQPTVAELARIAFDAYGESTGGLTWDKKPIPPFAIVAERTPHVARAWEAAVEAVLRARGVAL